MWEDANAWNSYYDSGGYDSQPAYDPVYDFGDSSMWSGTDYSQPYQDTSGWQPDFNPYQSSGAEVMKSDASYTYEPKYVPGALVNPLPEQMLSGVSSGQQMAERLGSHEGAMFYRNQPGMMNNPYFRDAEHQFAAEEMKNLTESPMGRVLLPPGVSRLLGITLPPAYSGAKWLAQGAPPWLRQYLPDYLTQASPPSWNEVWSGVRPFVWGKR